MYEIPILCERWLHFYADDTVFTIAEKQQRCPFPCWSLVLSSPFPHVTVNQEQMFSPNLHYLHSTTVLLWQTEAVTRL